MKTPDGARPLQGPCPARALAGAPALRFVDFNLLVVFDALFFDQSVTGAARRIGITQPAMSNALGRLRRMFGDDLFIRGASGMEPTKRAIELSEAVAWVSRQTERLLVSDSGFDAASASRSFTGRMSDLVGALVLTRLTSRLQSMAPGVSLTVLHMTPERALQAPETDRVDFAVSMGLSYPETIRAEPLMEDQMCCAMSASHPLASLPLTPARFLGLAHLKVSMSPTDSRFVDGWLAARGQQRKVVLNVPNWQLMPPLLRSGTLLAVVSRRFAELHREDGIVIRPLPFGTPPFDWVLYWHRRNDASPSQQWMRAQIARVCRELGPFAALPSEGELDRSRPVSPRRRPKASS